MKGGLFYGKIDQIGDPNKEDEVGRYRVLLDDYKIVTGWLFQAVRNSKDNQDDFCFDEGEPVAVFLEDGFRSGIVLGAIATKKYTKKVTDKDTEQKTFKDGSFIKYDRKNHVYEINIKGSGNKVNVISDNGDVTVDCKTATVKVSDEMKVDGKLHVTDDVKFDGKLDVTSDVNSNGKVTAATGVESQADVKAGGGAITLLTHKHPTSSPGSPTGTPI